MEGVTSRVIIELIRSFRHENPNNDPGIAQERLPLHSQRIERPQNAPGTRFGGAFSMGRIEKRLKRAQQLPQVGNGLSFIVKPALGGELVQLKPVKLQLFAAFQICLPQLPEAPGDHPQGGHLDQREQLQKRPHRTSRAAHVAPLPEIQLLLQAHPPLPLRSAGPLPPAQLGLLRSRQRLPAVRNRTRAAVPQGGGLAPGQAIAGQEPAEPQTHAARRGVPVLLLAVFGGDIARSDQSAASQKRQETPARRDPQALI